MSRVAWDLGRDAWRRFPRAPDAGPLPEWQTSGPEVPPGDYTVALTFKDTSASTKVTVRPDPRSKNTAADWARRWETIERAGELQEKAAEAAIRIRRTRDDVAAVEERLGRKNETLRDPAEKRKANESPLAKESAALKKALTEKESLLWSPPENAGISARDRVAQDLQTAAGNVASSWAPPGPTHLERLRQAEARLCLEARDPAPGDPRVAGGPKRHGVDGARLRAGAAAVAPVGVDLGKEAGRLDGTEGAEPFLREQRLAAAAAAVAEEGDALPHVLTELHEPARAGLGEEVEGLGGVDTPGEVVAGEGVGGRPERQADLERGVAGPADVGHLVPAVADADRGDEPGLSLGEEEGEDPRRSDGGAPCGKRFSRSTRSR